MTDVLAATGLESDGSLDFHSILPGDAGLPTVLSTSSFKLRFDRLLLPMSATRQAVCLQPMLGNVVNASTCGSGVFLEPSYDPVKREVTFRQTSDNPRLLQGVVYELTVYAAVADTDSGIRAFDGVPLASRVQVEFRVLPDPGGKVPPYDLGPQGDHWCKAPDPTCTDGMTCPRSVKSILQSCGISGCHLDSPDASSEGLQLKTAESILQTAINHTAHETETGESASTAQPNSLRFGRAMPVLDPNVPGESYLVYKLLANHTNALVIPFPTAPNAAPGADPPEVTRLRASVVVGMPMPPDNDTPPFLRAASPAVPGTGELEWLSEWILQGTPVTCGP